MDDIEISTVNHDRLADAERQLNQDKVTAVLIMGVGVVDDDIQITFCCPDTISEEDRKAVLAMAWRAILDKYHSATELMLFTKSGRN